MILLYAFPLGFMSIAYLQIVRVLWQSDNIPRHMTARPGAVGVSGSHRQNTFTMNSNASMEGQLRSRRKAAKMLVAVVVMFAVCYFPVHLFSVLRLLMQLPQNDTNTTLALLSHWMCYANSAVNPVIYNFMSGNFRREFRRAFAQCCHSNNPRTNYQLKGMSMRSNTTASTHVHGRNTVDMRSTQTIVHEPKPNTRI
ncbi:Tachykinin-like receptor at 86C [Carabus blaptoides fortunei]